MTCQVTELYDRGDVAGDEAVRRLTSGRHVDQCVTDTWQFSGQMIGCHVAQSWAATWHPGIGLYGLCQNFMKSGGFEPRTSPSASP
jgi:hypothetical protein